MIWNAQNTSWAPTPKSTNAEAAIVATHGLTPDRDMITRNNAPTPNRSRIVRPT